MKLAYYKEDAELVFFVTNLKEDARLVERMMAYVSEHKNIKMVLPTSAAELRSMYSELDAVISDRLHGLLIGMICGCTVLPLATRDKVRGYCKYLGIKNYLEGNEKLEEILALIRQSYDLIDDERTRLANFMEDAHRQVTGYYVETLKESGFQLNE